MSKDEKFVKSVYPLAEIQTSPSGINERVVSEPTMQGRWIGGSFAKGERRKWRRAAEAVRLEMLRKLEQ